jgi:hypothetical protein
MDNDIDGFMASWQVFFAAIPCDAVKQEHRDEQHLSTPRIAGRFRGYRESVLKTCLTGSFKASATCEAPKSSSSNL